MINITFSDSLSGSLKMADYYAKKNNSEIQDLKENIFSLYLNLDLGDISELSFDKKRENDFVTMFGNEDISFMRKWFNKEIKKTINTYLTDGLERELTVATTALVTTLSVPSELIYLKVGTILILSAFFKAP